MSLRKKNKKRDFGRLRGSDTSKEGTEPIPADEVWPWDRFSHSDIHWCLLEVTEDTRTSLELAANELNQALFCPYYVPLEGRLGADWGVIVNPRSVKFSKLVFEHWDCGCPTNEVGVAHRNTACQESDAWDVQWRHRCDDWCDHPCEALRWA